VLRQTVDSAGWGDAAVMVPHELYREYGDRAVLDRQYDSMRRWVDHLASLARRSPGRGRLFPRRLRNGLGRYIVDSGYHWGEWLRPGEDMVLTSIKHRLKAPAVVATAYLANSAKLLSEIAGILGRTDDAGSYGRLADKVREAWCLAFVRDGGARIGDDRQDDYVRALAFDLLPEGQRGAAAGRLAELVEAKDYHLGTGFLSTPLLLPVLARFGRPDLAYRLLLQDTSPSWLHQVEKGATTTWESWEGYDRHGNARYSHNHYAFGTVVAWLFRGVAGISPIEAGYRRIRFAPILGGELTHAVAEVMTPFGRTACRWRRAHGLVELQVTVPPGAEGEVHLGDGRVAQVDAGTFAFSWKEVADASPARRIAAVAKPRTVQKAAIVTLALGGALLAATLQYRRHKRSGG
jgi:alpha-L-rhamnosidase